LPLTPSTPLPPCPTGCRRSSIGIGGWPNISTDMFLLSFNQNIYFLIILLLFSSKFIWPVMSISTYCK
jgi:hypothetical protein